MTQVSNEPDRSIYGEFLLTELIDVDQLQTLMEKFTAATGTATALLDLKGNIHVASGWQDICTQFHRVHPESCKRCQESDVALANDLEKGGKYNIYRCLNGMVDVAIPVHVQGYHFANLFAGQFLSEKPDIEFFRRQALEYGFDEGGYLRALSKVPILKEEEVKLKLEYLSALATFLAGAGLDKMKLNKIMHELEDRVEERTRDLKEAQREALHMMEVAQDARQRAEQLNATLKGTMAELERSNKELQQFAYVASHDLQEPLRMVSSYVQLLQRRYQSKLDEEANEFIAFAVDGAERMQQLIQDLLAFSRVTTHGKPLEPTESGLVLDTALKNLEALLQESQAEVVRGEMPTVMADPGQLLQVLQNLIQNAVKFHGKSLHGWRSGPSRTMANGSLRSRTTGWA